MSKLLTKKDEKENFKKKYEVKNKVLLVHFFLYI